MKLTLRALPITLLVVSLACGAALAQDQPLPSGPFHSRFGLPLSRLDAQPTSPAHRQSQSSSLPPPSFAFGMIDFPRSAATMATGSNKAGHIAGGYGPDLDQDYPSDHGFTSINGVQYYWEHCFLYKKGVSTNCDAPFGPPAATQAWHVSNHNFVTGDYTDDSGTVYGFEAKVGK